MNKTFKLGALAAVMCATSFSAAHADTATTTGGFKIKSDDGNFDASLGGRIHFDYAYLKPDDSAYGSEGTKHYGSDSVDNASGAYFRRVFLTLGGHVYGWEYKIEDDLLGGQKGGSTSGSTTTTTTCPAPVTGKTSTCTSTSATTVSTFTPAGGFQDLYIAHPLIGSDLVILGQRKPFRAFEELQSNNEILFMERPVTSASGIFGGRDFQDGLYYKWYNTKTGLWAGGSAYSLSKAGQGSTEGVGFNGRIAYAPINKPGALLHIGASYSSDHADNGTAIAPKYTYGGYNINTPVAITLASYSGTSGVSAGKNAEANTLTGELAGVFGPGYFEAEYAHQELGAPSSTVGSSVQAYYMQGSVFVTGESKSYRPGDAVVAGNPKPIHSYGAVELKIRYENIKNMSIEDNSTETGSNVASLGCSVSGKPAAITKPTPEYIDQCKMHDISGGVNYYVNPNVRFMLDYMASTTNLGKLGTDKPDTIAARVQLSF